MSAHATAFHVSSTMILLFVPLILIELIMKIVALRDLWTREGFPTGERWIWTAVIVFVNTIGWLAYLLVGRQRKGTS